MSLNFGRRCYVCGKMPSERMGEMCFFCEIHVARLEYEARHGRQIPKRKPRTANWLDAVFETLRGSA